MTGISTHARGLSAWFSEYTASDTATKVNKAARPSLWAALGIVAMLGGMHGAASAQSVEAWSSVHISAGCEAMQAEMCVGAHGFTVNAQGHYVVGPNPSGRKLEGELSKDELAALRTQLAPVLQAYHQHPQADCQRRGRFMPGIWHDSAITLTNGHVVAASSKLGICQYGEPSDASKKLDDLLYQFAVTYYPRPF